MIEGVQGSEYSRFFLLVYKRLHSPRLPIIYLQKRPASQKRKASPISYRVLRHYQLMPEHFAFD